MNDTWIIWSIDHEAWWGPNATGYTSDESAAGRYSFAEARSIVSKPSPRAWSQRDRNRPSDLMVPSPEQIAARLAAA